MTYRTKSIAARRAALEAGKVVVPHGRASTYTNWGCRCAECRAANVTRCALARERRKALLEAGEVEVEHGKYTTYINYGCRCDECRAVNNVYLRAAAARRKQKRS